MLHTKYRKSFSLFASFLLGFALTTSSASAEQKSRVWVKAQGRMDARGALIVKKIKQRQPGKLLVLEGIIQAVTPDKGTFVLAGFQVFPKADARFTYVSGQPAAKSEIAKNVRVKAIGRFDASRFYASKVKIFQYSGDDDVEIEGPVELIDARHAQGRRLLIGSMPLILPNAAPTFQATSEKTGLNQFLDFRGKLKAVDNTQATDIPDDEALSATKRYGKLQTTFRTTFSTRVEAYSRLEFYWRDVTNPDALSGSRGGFDLRVRDLYLSLNDLGGIQGLQFRVGRQRFRDRRTWLMDSRLDALKLAYGKPSFRFSFAVTRALSDSTTHRDQLHYIGTTYFYFGRALKSTFYMIKEQDQRQGRDDPLWLAINLRGKVARLFEWWAQGAKYSSKLGEIDRTGYGYDAGLILRPLSRRNGPFLSYHRAYGSADNKDTATKRESFRQPRLQLNYYKSGANKRLFYYGSLLTPELSNLKFQAIGLGYVFSPRISIQGMLRTYDQINASTIIRSNSLGIAPLGVNTDLGQDVEVLLDLFPIKPLEISLSAEWFMPGDAFAADIGTEFGLHTEFIFYF